MSLHISDTLDLPLEWLQLASVIYGMPGTGKSVLGRVVCEEAHKAGVRFNIIDLTGAHYGLKSSSDGKRDGLPVVIFGGDHADLPLNIKAGTSCQGCCTLAQAMAPAPANITPAIVTLPTPNRR